MSSLSVSNALFRLQANQIFKTDCPQWSDRICVSRHHQPICVGCCGNNVGINNYVRWWRGSPTQKHEKWRSITSSSKQSPCQVAVQNSFIAADKLSDGGSWFTYILLYNTLWCTSVTPDLTSSLCAASRVGQKTLLLRFERPKGPDWDTSVQIWSESHFKPPPHVAWIWFAKITFHVFF